MNTEEKKTSEILYSKIQKCINAIDIQFFSGNGKEKIPELVFAINNQVRSCVVAFVQANALYDKSNDTKLQYMGINPYYLNRSVPEILSTICHELCHIYEHAYIHIPRGGYHDKNWDALMRDCGLEPIYMNSSRTAVSHKIIVDGVFETFAKNFEKENGEDFFNIVEYSAKLEDDVRKALGIEDGEDGEDGTPRPDNADKKIKKYNRNKIKYTCPTCGLKMWGKSGLKIMCCECSEVLEEEKKEDENKEED